jgi:phage baseplate assembly protein W|tara:strand:- start:3769 stop:4134 length:366 start_codon:yes stop_codon:yes gene_type:complete
MSSIGIKLPINYDSSDGFSMLKNSTNAIKQNFKMLILTTPGERIMDPQFGVGIKTYLFLNYTENVEQKIRSKIIKQVAMYIPIIKIINLDFSSGVDYNSLGIRIEYSIPDLGTTDLLEFTI